MSLPLWARLVVLVAAAKVGLGLVLYLSGGGVPHPRSPAPLWVSASMTAAFAVLGGLLLAGNRRDPRAAWLGGVFLLIAAPLVPGVNLFATSTPGLSGHVRPEALLPAFLWMFVREFPSPLSGRLARVARLVFGATLPVGLGCAAANLSLLWWPSASPEVWRPTFLAASRADSWYWLIISGLSLSALPALLWRAHTATPEDRPRVRLFVRGLLLGVAPFAMGVLAEQTVPAYDAFTTRDAVKTVVGAVMFGLLATVPFLTAYSVLFDRVVEMRVVLRAALQYALARYTIAAVAFIPFAALAVFVYGHRSEALVSLLAGPRPLLLGGTTALALASLRMRHRWLAAVDRRYFREPYDAQQTLTRFIGDLRAENPQELATRIAIELDRAMHVAATVFLTNDARTALRDARGAAAPLAAGATLVELARNDPLPMDVDLGAAGSSLQRLSDAEKRWVLANDVRLVVALKGGDGKLAGLIALSAKRSGLAFSAVDRQLISAVAAAGSLALDNLRLRSTPQSPSDPPAQECLECSRLNPADAACCGCGGAVAEAHVPHLLRGTFRLEQRLGAGGMGVVYRAVDVNLGRAVAIKTLPKMSTTQAARLRKEARAMAMVTHPNLAVIHGIETWREIPFLVEEYLAGGTLAGRLSSSRPSLAEAMQLGITLADALEQLHVGRILHCDIKPSNIGFTQHGVVKLLDFGLARLLREVSPPSEVLTIENLGPEHGLVAPSTRSTFAGTPHYMSPEAARGEPPTPAVDVWGLSVVLYETIAGRRPFEGESAHEIFANILAARRPDLAVVYPGCPAPVASLFDRLLSLDPAVRPRDSGTLRRQLQALHPVTS